MAITLIDSILVQGNVSVSGGFIDGVLANITGDNVLIVAITTSRGFQSNQTHTLYYESTVNPMAAAIARDQNLNGFLKGRASVAWRHIGSVVNKTETCRVEVNGTTGNNGIEVMAAFMAFANVDPLGVQGTYNNGTDSAAGSDSFVAPDDLLVSGLALGSATTVPTPNNMTQVWNLGRSGAGTNEVRHASAYNFGSGSRTVGWTWGGSAFIHVAAGFSEVVNQQPTITQINNGSDVNIVDTAIPVQGSSFSNTDTRFWIGNGTDFNAGIKEEQSISSITPNSFTWNAVTMGALSLGLNYGFAVTNGTQISSAFPVTIVSPPAPVITDIDGGSTADTTDTNLPVNGTDFVTVGTTELWLADGTNFSTATKFIQAISTITNTSVNWDSVQPGTITPGARYLFIVTDAGQGGEQVSAAFPFTLTDPSTPVINTVNGELEVAEIFDNWTNQTIAGTDFDSTVSGGVTQVWLSSSTDFNDPSRNPQVISSITPTTINWDAVEMTGLSHGLLFLFVVTEVGTVQERVSGPFSLLVLAVEQPFITSVDGSNAILNTATNMHVTGGFFYRPGVEAFWLADGTDFNTANKIQQGIDMLDFFSFTWPAVQMGGFAFGALYLFYQTDVGGPNEQTSGPFTIFIAENTLPQRIEAIGDDLGMVLAPVIDDTPIEPDKNVLLLRDHQCWAGLGDWYVTRDLVQAATIGDIVLKGSLDGVWPTTVSARVNSAATSFVDQLTSEELLGIFTAAGREVFSCGFWMHKTDMLTRGDVSTISLFQIESDNNEEYLEIFVQREPDGKLYVGCAYEKTTRFTFLHSADLSTVSGDWVFIQAEWKQTAPYMTLRVDGVESTNSSGDVPYGGTYNDIFVVHDFTLQGGANTPALMFRFQGMFYGFGAMSLADSNLLRDALTLTQYEITLKDKLTPLLRYFRCDDTIPDRFLHNHSEDLNPGRLISGGVQRGLGAPPYGTFYRIFNGCYAECPVSEQANFDNWDATISGHLRFQGGPNDVGLLFRLQNPNSGSSLELVKLLPGAGPNEQNGMLEIVVRDDTGSIVFNFVVNNPGLDPFDGTFTSFALTTGFLGSDWGFSLGDVGTVWWTSLGVDVTPVWHNSPYQILQVGGMFMDIHSWAYASFVDPTAHTTYHTGWTTLDDIISYAQGVGLEGFYWCQGPVSND